MLYPVPRVDVSERRSVIAFVCLVLATLGFTMLADMIFR
jgi:hypothetical protein